MTRCRSVGSLQGLAAALCVLAALLAAAGIVLVAVDRHLPSETDYGTSYGGLPVGVWLQPSGRGTA